MNRNLSTSTNSGKSANSDNFTYNGSTSSLNSNSIPPVPKKKQLQQMVKQENINMNPMPTQTTTEPWLKKCELTGSSESKDSAEQTVGKLSDIELQTLNEENQDNYLTPTDPPSNYTEISLPIKTAGLTPFNHKSGSLITRLQEKRKPILRLDSGVGDGESSRGSGSVKYNMSPPPLSILGSEPSSPVSTHYDQPYEDIDHYNKIHEQHTDQRQQQQQNIPDNSSIRSRSMQNGFQSQTSLMNISGVTTFDSKDSEHAISSQISDSGSRSVHELPHAYMQLSTKSNLEDSQKQLCQGAGSCMIVIAIIIILLFSLTALVLSILVHVNESKCFNPHCSQGNQTVPDMNQALEAIQQRVDTLMKENQVLAMQLKNATQYLEQETVQVSLHFQNLSGIIQSMNTKFEAEIANISLTPGPQGPAGIVNFSMCINRTISVELPTSATESTRTSYLPTDLDLQNYFVTFAFCAYSGATDVYLETEFSFSRPKYCCKCWGQVPGKNQTKCTLTVWMCPYTS